VQEQNVNCTSEVRNLSYWVLQKQWKARSFASWGWTTSLTIKSAQESVLQF